MEKATPEQFQAAMRSIATTHGNFDRKYREYFSTYKQSQGSQLLNNGPLQKMLVEALRALKALDKIMLKYEHKGRLDKESDHVVHCLGRNAIEP